MNKLTQIWWTAKTVGWDNVPRRLLQAWRVKSGSLRRRTDPSRYSDKAFRDSCNATAEEQPARWRDRCNRFLPLPDQASLMLVADDANWQASVTKVCELAVAGQYPFFSHWTGQIDWPPNFNLDPVHDIDWPVGEHWTTSARSGPPRHDIKLVWEPNRFTLAFHLARAYRRDDDARWAQAFWDMFDAWIKQNPPQMTVAWGCGQETAFRLMAMLTAAFATLDSPHATAKRLYKLTRLAWQSARRIEANINYAIAQENNHALSEALGLWTVGLLFDEFPSAQRWKSMGRRVLQKECNRQIYNDGSFIQHSLSYHRVMLDDLMWCIRLGDINSEPLPKSVLDRFRLATDWLAQMTDPATGRTPNYGSNDGANVLPLACADYLDYHPTLQAAHWIAHNRRCLEPGPWDEKLLWLCGSEALTIRRQPVIRGEHWSAPVGGYHILRGPLSWLMVRCGTYRDRPHQADMLHVDLWHKGENILRDAGSFLYYHDDPVWNHYFHSTAAHNTIEIDGQDQMIKGPRFLWFRWPEAHVVRYSQNREQAVLDLQNQSYNWLATPVQHRRLITRNADNYEIRDTLHSAGQHTARLRWRLFDTAWRPVSHEANTWQASINGTTVHVALQCAAAMNVKLVAGQETLPEGWESLYYGEKQPSPTLVATAQFGGEIVLTTTVSFH